MKPSFVILQRCEIIQVCLFNYSFLTQVAHLRLRMNRPSTCVVELEYLVTSDLGSKFNNLPWEYANAKFAHQFIQPFLRRRCRKP